MGRSKTNDFQSEEFQKLSREERQIRGRLSTLKRMIKTREVKIEVLLKPIEILQNEISGIEEEVKLLKEKIKGMGFDFPSFRIEEYGPNMNTYYRGVWYVNSKKKQLYLGNEKKVIEKTRLVYPEIESKKGEEKLNLIRDVYLKDLQLEYWNKQYEDEKQK
jgi:hypothetical protein